MLALFSAVAISGGLMVALAPAASASPAETVSFCHRTNAADSANNPYNAHIDQSINSLNGHTDKNKDGSHTVRGDHQGPVWSLGMKAENQPWGDIIEPNSWLPRGYNWYVGDSGNVPNVAGQEILQNGCKIPSASLSLVKTANPASFSTAGAVINYTFTVTNTGASTITDLAIDDYYFSGKAGPLDPITCTDQVLAPESVTTCSATYTTIDADVTAATSIRNTAKATGSSFGRTVTSNDSSAVVTFDGTEPPQPGYELWKTSVADWASNTITYTLHMQRTSAVEVTDAGATDLLPAGVTLQSGPTATAGSIANNAGTIEWTGVTLDSTAIATATFTVSVTAGPGSEVLNVAAIPEDNTEGKCRFAGNADLCRTTDTVPEPEPAMSWWIKKTASPSDTVSTGGTITYTLTATNIAGTDVGGAQVVDTLPPGVEVDESLLPGELDYNDASRTLTWTFNFTSEGSSVATVSFPVTVTAGPDATVVNKITGLSDGGACEPLDRQEFRGVNGAFVQAPGFESNANCETTNHTPSGSGNPDNPGNPETPGNTPNTPTDTTPQIEVLPQSNAEPPVIEVQGVSQELPPAPAIEVKPAAHVAAAPSANAHTGQGQSPWVYLLFGAGALLMLGAWRVRRNGNA